ncbi:cytochrome P450 [Stachybotrys elegans]|uniref:Cytochrome P450 n=1 Tax=Stachybotrys elegans TaxID=80388 RepID=A0A8K0T6H4_9HYPO|nr:cytochrome P450 [Stachybotrys elegans]
MHVTPGGNSLYICNPDSLMEIFKRRSDFPRPLQLFELLNVFGPNLSTVEGHQWKKQRKLTGSCFNEQNNQLVWLETISQAEDMIRYWSSRPEIRSTADDTRTLSLHVLSRAGFGKSFQFQGREVTTGSSDDYKASLQVVLDNCVLIMALGTQFLSKPWLPRRLKRVHEACVSFQQYMTSLYEQEKPSSEKGSKDNNLMTALVRASTSQDGLAEGLTEKEIYGNMFVFNFAGHDTTAHTLTFVVAFLATNPFVQDWLHEEIRQVFGQRISQPTKWVYDTDFNQLKRCQAALMETIRLYTPVPVAKWTGPSTQTLKVNNKTITIPPETMVIPSYAAIHTHPRFWSPDPLVWKPSRWIVSSQGKEELLVPDRGTFIPWSEGERSCPGKKFSQVEVVATLAVILRSWKVEPVRQSQESIEDARRRVLQQIETDSAQVLLLQMLHPERAPLVWRRR